MAKTLIVYSSDTGATRAMGDFIAEELRCLSIETDIRRADEVTCGDDLDKYDVLLFGSASYHRSDLECLRNLLDIATQANLKGKIGGAFGSANWLGDTPDHIIFDIMNKTLGMDMLNAPLKLHGHSLDEDSFMAQSYAQEIANKLFCN